MRSNKLRRPNRFWGYRVAPIIFMLILALGTGASSQSIAPHYLLALSKADHTLAIVNPKNFKVLARVPVGIDPHEVIASADGRTAFVTNYGWGSLHQLYVIDLVHFKALPIIDTKPFMGPHGLAEAGGKIYFTAEGSKSIARYDPRSQKIDWCMGTGQDRTHMIYVTSDAREIYTTNVSSATVSIIQDTLFTPPPMRPPSVGSQPHPSGPGSGFGPHIDWRETVLDVGKGSEGFDVSPDGRVLWTAGAQDGRITIIDLSAKKVIESLDAKVIGANRLKFTPDGKMVLISSLRNGDLWVYDAGSRKLLKTISLGHGAAGILVDPDGKRAFIGCTPDNYVAVVNLKTLRVTGQIDVGGGPDGLAWSDSH